MRRCVALWVAFIMLSLALQSSQVVADDTVAIVGAVVIDGNGGVPIEDGVVIVHGSSIAALGPRPDVNVPDDALIIDGRGLSVLPGLADMHVHLVGGWDGVSVDMLGYQRYLNALLYAGVTTVLDTGNVMPYVLQLRDEVAAGKIAGPRIYCVGALVDGADPIWPPIAMTLVSRFQVPGIVDLLERSGVDAIKAYVGVSVPLLSELVRVASERSLSVIADLGSRTGSYDAAATGIAAFAHLPSRAFDSATLELVQANNVKVITTLATKESFSRERLQDLSFLDHPLIADTNPPAFTSALRNHATRELTPAETEQMVRWQSVLEVGKENARTLAEADVMVVAGTDAPYPGTLLGEGIHRELELLVEAGLSPLAAISTATRNAAALMQADDWGTLEIGKTADLILVRGRPDQHIRDTRNVELVMQSGRILDRAALKFDPNTDQGFGVGTAVDGAK